ncbi:MAG TPA: hypothetical protein PLC98_19290 [Anaerolineales bacterium]|nr:hypothetical protein [Anaerolineales bacterium]
MADPTRRALIRASEIGTYIFCARAWWLQRVEGLEPGNVAQRLAGEAYHASHGRRIWAATQLRRLAWALIVVAIGLWALWQWGG